MKDLSKGGVVSLDDGLFIVSLKSILEVNCNIYSCMNYKFVLIFRIKILFLNCGFLLRNSHVVIFQDMISSRFIETDITGCWVVSVGVIFKVVDNSQCKFGILSGLGHKVVFQPKF